MFDITSSKLFLLAIVALLVIGPKDFPVLLRTIGRYVGIIRGHAKEFRAQFDEAMRESELAQLKTEMESIGRETQATLNETQRSVEQTFSDAQRSVEATVTNPLAPGSTEVASTEIASTEINGGQPAPAAVESSPAVGPEPAGETTQPPAAPATAETAAPSSAAETAAAVTVPPGSEPAAQPERTGV